MDVSIIIPVYNVAPYIKDCLASVMRQTYQGKMECLVIDDCGTDDSIAIAERMVAAYDGPIQFQIIHHEHNRGRSVARNTGTLQATGDYLYYLDSDDEIADDCIAILMQKALDDPELEMVQGNFCYHPIQGVPYRRIKKQLLLQVRSNSEVRQCFYKRLMSVNIPNKLFKRDFIITNHIQCQEGLLWEDTPWSFILLKHLKRACFVSDVTYHYKYRPFSTVTGTQNKIRGMNYSIIYRDILAHLTPGYERMEFNYYAKVFAQYYVRLVHDAPELKEVFLQYKKYGKQYGSLHTCFLLAVYSVLGRLKYGWVIKSLLHHLCHPTKIRRTLNRVWLRKKYDHIRPQ